MKGSALPRDPAELWRRLQLQLLASSSAHQPRPRPARPGEGAFAGFSCASAGACVGGDLSPFP